jgi:O-antigen/teichoic acid export membrane protein
VTDAPPSAPPGAPPDAPREQPAGPSWARIVVTFALAISGASAVAYAAFLPIYPFTDQPVPVVWLVFGALEVAAAVGVFRLRTWGRWLGVAVIIVTVLLNIARALVGITGTNATAEFLSFVLGFVLDLFILWWLLFRWPDRLEHA